jgi:hypothetical protein
MATIPFAFWKPGFVDVNSLSLLSANIQYVDCGPTNGIFNATTAYTVSVWFKTRGTATLILLNGASNPTSLGPIILESQDGILIFSASDPSANVIKFTGSTTVNDDNWHQFVGTYNGLTGSSALLTASIDGSPYFGSFLGNGSFTGLDNTQSAVNFNIGANYEGSRPWNGYIDSIVILIGTAINSTQVTEFYSGGTVHSPLTMSFGASVTNWWSVGEGADNSTTIFDTVGGKNGTLVNSPVYSTNIP